MFTPGATISGFAAPSPSRGPRLEKSASRSCLSTAPTVSALDAAPGDSMLTAVPSLPAATTNSLPVCAVSASRSRLTGSVPSVGWLPRLMLTTLAPLVAAHSIPAMIQESSPLPSSVSTLPTISFAPGATPRYFPPEAAPDPVMMDATWVPCPWPSTVVPLSVKSLDAATFPWRSGWSGSRPVSRTATVTPVPSKPACHAAGAPICGTLWSSAARTLWSNQTACTPSCNGAARPPAGAPGGRNPAQNSPAWPRATRTAWACVAGRVRVTRPAASGRTAAAAVRYVTMSGRVDDAASSSPSRVSCRTLNSSRSRVRFARNGSASEGTTYSPGAPPGPVRSSVVNVTGRPSGRGAGSTTTRGRPPADTVYSTWSPVSRVRSCMVPAATAGTPGTDAAFAWYCGPATTVAARTQPSAASAARRFDGGRGRWVRTGVSFPEDARSRQPCGYGRG